jgi:hypothetical protein
MDSEPILFPKDIFDAFKISPSVTEDITLLVIHK